MATRRQLTFSGKTSSKKESDYSRRLKGFLKKRITNIDSDINHINNLLTSQAYRNPTINSPRWVAKQNYRRGLKKLVHRRKEILNDIKDIWTQYKKPRW